MARLADAGLEARSHHAGMQTVVRPLPAQSPGPGHQVAEMPLAPTLPCCEWHALAPGCSVQWPAGRTPPLLLLTEGLGKAALDGAALRLAAPCALRVPATATLRLSNQGTTPMRWLAVWLQEPPAARPAARLPGVAPGPPDLP
jgi:hypothetical protein